MKRKRIKGKIKFIYSSEKKSLEKTPFLKSSLKEFSFPTGFIQGNYIISRSSSFLSVLRSDPEDVPNYLNVDEYRIVSIEHVFGKSLFDGPYEPSEYHQTTPEKLKKVNPYIILSA